MSVLRCEKLHKNYGTGAVLKELELTLESGKIYGLLGRNGAGKTTLFSLLSNQVPSSHGRATLDGEDIWENRQAMDRIFFSRDLTSSVTEGLGRYTLDKYYRLAAIMLPHWDNEKARLLTERFRLNRRTKLMNLSAGMCSMVANIVAISSGAEFTFMDEPVAGLDPVARADFYRLLLEEFAESGRTFVLSTHIIEEAADILEEVIFLKQGKLLLKENTQNLLSRAVSVSGRTDQVDAAVSQLEHYPVDEIGRRKNVAVLLKPGEQVPAGYDVTVWPMSLQEVFVALCGKGER